MQRTAPTRMALLSLRRQRDFASKGAGLLRTKREALLKELLALGKPLVEAHTALAGDEREARRSLLMAKALDGRHRLLSAGMTATPALVLSFRERKVWGVAVAAVSPEAAPPGKVEGARYHTARIRETAEAFAKVLERLVEIAPLEIRLKRLGPEVRRTSRRINALEQILIPRLENDVEAISRALEEIEREDMFRLRRIKKKREDQG